MKKVLLIVAGCILGVTTSMAQQLDIDGVIRPRYEYRHGYGKLISPDEDAANFISQRARLNVNFKKDKITLGMSIQNVRVWGDVGTMARNDKGIAFHQAWGQIQLMDKLAIKVGRQVISYDDQRIFGGVGWAQQARSHDALIVKLTPNPNHKIDLGLAYNADGEFLTDSLYSNVAGYKTFQYGWYHGNFNKVGISFLLLNVGIEYLDDPNGVDPKSKTDFFQTIGPRITYKTGKLMLAAAGYVQTGSQYGETVSAAYADANVSYQFHENWSATIGGAYLSGNDQDSNSSDQNAFNPIFGTNHKFNGLMDYFYVGNHAGSVGLVDINAAVGFKKNKFSAKIAPHMFQSAANIVNPENNKMDSQLGTEIDFTAGYKLAEYANLQFGYSQIFATESMEALKGGSKDEVNNWAWVMLTINPHLFSSKPKTEK